MIRSFDVAVVGLGAMGSAAAYHLSKRGCNVLGIDRFSPPHAHGATLRYEEPVTRWHIDGDGVRIVSGSAVYRAGRLLLTAGAWIGSLVPELALPLVIERQVVYWLSPLADDGLFAPTRCPIHL